MWLFSKDSLANFQYTKVSDKGTPLLNGWTLYNCTSRKGEELSMLVHDSQIGADMTCIQNAIKRLKTLKHPDIVSYVDSCEGTKEIQIITERVQTLEQYLREKSDSGNLMFISSWGIYEVMRALVFLSDTCKCKHNQIRLSSVFVNKSGDWKLGALDHISGSEEVAPGTVIQSEIYWPQDRCLVDSYGLGCLLWEIYNRSLAVAGDLKSPGLIPSQLVKVFQRLTHPRSKMRLSLSQAFKDVTAHGGLCDNYYVQTLLFLEEIQIKDEQEKKQFMATLSDRVDTFPDEINKYKVLPHLLTCHQFGAAGIEVLVPLVKLGKLLDPSEFETKVVPCLIAMFRSSHRGTRVRLLEQLPSFIDHLPLKTVDTEIFPAVLLGMADTNPVVREATIRSVVHLAPKLASKNLNDTLVKHLMNSQLKDEQGGIRTNATVCLAKIAPHLATATRQTHLLNVLLKCTRDPFTPARLSAVSALAASQHFFLVEDVATKLLPCLSFLTIDGEHEVRDQTFKALKFALTRLEEWSENPDSSKTSSVENKEAQNAISWTNWAVNLSTRLIKKNEGANHQEATPVPKEAPRPATDAILPRPPVPASTVSQHVPVADTGDYDDDDDDEWAPIEEKVPEKAKAAPPPPIVGWQDDPDAFFDTLIGESEKPVARKGLNLGGKATARKNQYGQTTTAAKKTAVSNDDGWGDTDW